MAVDKENNTIDFLLTKKRDKKAAKRFFVKAIKNNGLPKKVTSEALINIAMISLMVCRQPSEGYFENSFSDAVKYVVRIMSK